MRVGIIGAGKLGTVLARLAVTAGHEVLVAGRPGSHTTPLVLEVMALGAQARPVEDWPAVDVAVLAVPLPTALRMDLPLPAGTVAIDATNHWPTADGDLPELDGRSSSELVAERHPSLRWAKSLNHLGYHDLDPATRDVHGTAIAIASDDEHAADTTARYLRTLGLHPVRIGPLPAGRALESTGPVFGAPMSAEDLRHALALTHETS